jgi:hypothetical protein
MGFRVEYDEKKEQVCIIPSPSIIKAECFDG